MAEQHGKTLVPQIRFAGFTDPWEQRKLGELYQKNDERNTDGLGSERTLSVASMTFNSAGNGADDSSLPNYKRLRLGDIAFEGHANKEFAYGRFVLNDAGNGIMSPRFTCLRPIAEQEYSFWKYFIHSEKVMRPILVNSTKSGTMMNELVVEDFLKQEILVPSLPEQCRIGAFFDRLDSLITLHQRKYDKLCVLKKSMLDKMFPKGGSLYPEIRFAGFTDPWEQRKLSELVEIERGGSPRPIERYITDDPCGLNWVKIGDAPELGRYITQTTEKIKPEGLAKTRQVYPGDLVLSNSMSFGRPYIMAIKGCIHDGWLLIRDAQKHFDPIFLCHMLGAPQMLNQYRMFAAGSTVNNLNKELVGKAIVSLPSKDEQREIGIVFDRLDSLITLHQRKYDGCANPLFLERRISCRKPSHQNRCSATTTPSG